MADANSPSHRVWEQTIRNTLVQTLVANLEVERNLTWGLDEYFEMWGDGAFPWPEGGALTLHPNTALSDEERQALTLLVDVLNEAWSATDGLSQTEFLATDWPPRIASLTSQALRVMTARGRFSEKVEETEPSQVFQVTE